MSELHYSPIVELRMYTLHPGRREELIRLFEREFIETQEAVGIQLLGQFYDLDDPNRFIWLRGFHDMPSRAHSLNAFYSGPVWKEHRDAANATMIDSDNVLLLRPAEGKCGFTFLQPSRPPLGNRVRQESLVVATIYYFDGTVDAGFLNYFETTIQPALSESGASILAYFVTEDSPNTFPRLPVREGENVFVWFAGFQDQEEYKEHLARLRKSKIWIEEIVPFLKEHLQNNPETLRLAPTPRSWLTGLT